MSTENMDALSEEVADYVKSLTDSGFYTPDEIVETAIALFQEVMPETITPLAERLTAEQVQAHRQAELAWPEVTDCDRLDAAFAELNASGIVSRQNFSCCFTCGIGEMIDEAAAEEENGLCVRGYTMYNVQGTEAAAAGYGLYLDYGAVENEEKAALRIGREVVETLNRHNLTTQWNEQWDTRIEIRLDWKRRLPKDTNQSGKSRSKVSCQECR